MSSEPALFGQHVLEQWLESGPDGTRYAARDAEGREVELWTLDERWVRLHTARIARLRRIEHGALLRILDVGADQLVMERSVGTWDDPALRPASLDELTSATRGLALALAEAHELGVVHGSLALSHASLTRAGAVALDLVGARVRTEHEDLELAPELGGDAVPTAAADLWSLGAIVRHALAALPAEGSERLRAIVDAMQADDPESRPTARAIADRLEGKATVVVPSDAGETALPDGIPNVLGPYAIDEQIGSGGMGRVFRAHDVATGDPVALKVLVKQWAKDPDAVARFRREARLLARLESPFVARFVQANEAHGHHYLAMELVEGQSARGLLKERGPLPVDATLSIAVCVARALGDVHSLGLVHRDIKPSNVLIQADSRAERPAAKLCDFGIARAMGSEEPQLTVVGTPGTPCYMAPEQVSGDGLLDARVDVYAFGVMLYELLVGQPPFVGIASAVMLAHVSDEPQPIRERRSDVPEALAAIVHRALAKAPHARQADANELLAELEAFWHGDPVGEEALPQALALSGTPIVYDNAWTLSSSPRELWPHVSNTERFNRAIGLNDVEWMSTQEDGALHREGELRSAGLLLRWKENPFEWVAPHRLGVVREYSSGPFEWLRSMVWLEPHGTGTHLHHRIEIRPRGLVGRIAAGIEVGLRMKRAMERVYRHVDESCRRIRDGQGGATFDPFESPTDLGSETGQRLDAKLSALVTAGADPYVVEALGRFVRTAPAPRLGRIRPRELAREHDLDEALVLDALLRAAHEGVLVVLWDVLCPTCRIPSSIAESLQRLTDHGRCEACDLDFELDLARSVELVFRIHPEIRAADLGVYCIGGPAHSPHVLAQVRLQAGQRLALDLGLPEGSYRVTGRGMPGEHAFRVHPKASLSSWELPLAKGLPPSVARSLATGEQHIALTNDLDREVVVRVESASERSDAFTAADAAAHALFRELFPNELLSPSQLIGISEVALLFAEAGDPSLRYESDDRESYQGLSELLARVREAAELEGGALVKLHGDAVLAVFTGPAAAVRAGLRLMRADVRASVHSGPAMMTTIQERLDYFGRTVNVGAAMAQQSGAGELLVSEAVQKDEVVAELLRTRSRPSGVVRVGPIIATRQRCARSP